MDCGLLDDPFLVVTERKVDGIVLRNLLNEISVEERRTNGLETITRDTFAPLLKKEA